MMIWRFCNKKSLFVTESQGRCYNHTTIITLHLCLLTRQPTDTGCKLVTSPQLAPQKWMLKGHHCRMERHLRAVVLRKVGVSLRWWKRSAPLGEENLLTALHDSTQECNMMKNVEAAEEILDHLITLHGYNVLRKKNGGVALVLERLRVAV